jgi:hypothetical protein
MFKRVWLCNFEFPTNSFNMTQSLLKLHRFRISWRFQTDNKDPTGSWGGWLWALRFTRFHSLRRPLTIRGTPANNTPATATFRWLLVHSTGYWFAPLVCGALESSQYQYPYGIRTVQPDLKPPQPTSARRSRKSMSLSLKPCRNVMPKTPTWQNRTFS